MPFYIGQNTTEPSHIRSGSSEQWGHVDMIFYGSQPIWPAALTGIADIVGGYDAQMAVTSDGKLLCRGANGPESPLGMSHPYIPDEYYTTGGLQSRGDLGRWFVNPNISNVRQAALGTSHSLVLLNSGIAYGCGYNFYGQLGIGTTAAQQDFVQVVTGVKAVFANGHSSFIIKNDNSLWCAGQCHYDATDDYSTTWKSNAQMTNVVEVAPGDWANWSCRKTDGTVWAFTNTSGTNLSPIANGTNAVSVAYQYYVKSDGTLWKIYDVYPSREFRQVAGISNAKQIVYTDYGTYFIVKNDGTLLGMSPYNHGQLGFGDQTARETFTAIPGISNAKKVTGSTSSTAGYTMVLTNANTIYAAAGRKGQSSPVGTFGLEHTFGWRQI